MNRVGRRERSRWRDLPLAVAMLAPSADHPRRVRALPARPRGVARPTALRQLRQQLRVARIRTVRRHLPVDRVPERTARHDQVRPDHGATRAGRSGVGLAVLADKYLRGIGAFRTIFSSTVATSVAVASLMWLFLLQPSVGALANVGWFNSLFPSVKDPGLAAGPRHRARRSGAVECVGGPRVHVHPRDGRPAGDPP